ncbi:hypothetical protein [Agrococcus sp. SGAir0287]|uniref:hypothetical protein n=1 Tax=Agrococcus sp. SGAir0287 TaxID=2070347 RepID=UPI0010CD6767|nr:hypothetical protein [Agrococcus sp. SGAir0287]QCR18056.1 hypothetical protein C1N71_00185 [Agrococcus sp. SGAir0287]
MSVDIPDAVTWARAVVPERASLADLEAHVLRHDHAALRALGRRRVDDPGGRRHPVGGRVGTALLVIASLLALAAPVVGFAVVVADGSIVVGNGGARIDVSEPLDAAVAFPIVAACFGVAVALPLSSLAFWLRRQRVRLRSDLALPGATLVLALLTLPVVLRRADEGASPAAALAATGVAAAVSVATMLALLLVSRPAERTRDWFPVTGLPDSAAAGAAIAVLPEGPREAMRAERREALEALVARGLLGPAERERADAAPLGALVELDRRT